ncbi:MAG: metallophosphoesterase [Raineya sp.]|jgi:serine/threonine protein phosphatase 1|nr:metallophosphoesterase [Raineya sp.]
MSRTFVVGDIHGCFDELMELLENLALKPNDLLISVGDIVDKGNKSLEVYQFFKNRPNSVVLMGNHERKHLNQIFSYSQEIVKLQFGEEYQDFLKWLQTLPYYYETPDAIIVHAAFEQGKSLQEQREDVLCGATAGERYLETLYPENTYWNDYYTDNKPIIYGHHVVGDSPKIKNNTYGIDTGCCHEGFLTIIELPDFKIHQLKAKKDYWKEEQIKWQIPVLKSKDWNNMSFENIQKQLEKLSYIQEPETRNYLTELENWTNDLKDSLPVILQKIKSLTQNLLEQFPEDFNQKATQYPFSTYLFKAKANNLHLKDLEKGLKTPQKILDITHIL